MNQNQPDDATEPRSVDQQQACYALGSACPDCGETMDYDGGNRMTREEPEIPPCLYCPNCGTEYGIAHNVQDASDVCDGL